MLVISCVQLEEEPKNIKTPVEGTILALKIFIVFVLFCNTFVTLKYFESFS